MTKARKTKVTKTAKPKAKKIEKPIDSKVLAVCKPVAIPAAKTESLAQIISCVEDSAFYQTFKTPHGGDEKISWVLIDRLKVKLKIDGYMDIATLIKMADERVMKIFLDGKAESYVKALEIIVDE